jgi:hypothetical protein
MWTPKGGDRNAKGVSQAKGRWARARRMDDAQRPCSAAPSMPFLAASSVNLSAPPMRPSHRRLWQPEASALQYLVWTEVWRAGTSRRRRM